MKRLRSIALLGAIVALGVTACDSDTGPVPGVDSVDVSPDNVTVEVGGTAQLTASVSTQGDASSDVTWSSSNPSVASVDSDGTVTGNAEGNAEITATSVEDATKSDASAVTVTAPEPKKISIAGFRALSNTGGNPVPAPDTVGTECCGSSSHVVLEVTYDVDPGEATIERVQLTMNGEVVSEQVFSSDEAAAFSHREQDVVISKNTLAFQGELDGSVITPDLPNDSYEIGGKVVFSDGTEATVNQTRTTFVKNHNRVIFARVDGGNTGVSPMGLRFWGGTTINFSATVIDHAGVGVGALTIVEDDATADTDYDMGAGVDAAISFSGPPFTFATDAAANAGLAGAFDPMVSGGLVDSDGESYASQNIPWVEEYQDPFLTGTGSPVTPSEALPLDYAAPTASGDVVVVNSAASSPNVANADKWFSVGEFQASTQSDVGVGIIDSTAFLVGAPAPPSTATDSFAPVDSINDLPERTTEYGVVMSYIEDILGNANTSPAAGPNGEFGVDFGAPVFSNQVPASEGLILKGEPDNLSYMLTFFAEDDTLATGDPGSGADHASTTIEIFQDGSSVATATATDGTGAAGSDFDFNSDDAAPDGDYHADVVALAGEGMNYTAEVNAPDLAIIPNVGVLEYGTFHIDATPPTTTMINPPSRNVSSSNSSLTFSITGEASDNFGLSEVLITVRVDDPTVAETGETAVDECSLADPLATEGTGPGEVSQATFDVTSEAQAGDEFSRDVTIQNNETNATDNDGENQHFCFFIEASDVAQAADGSADPWTSESFAHTDLDWQ